MLESSSSHAEKADAGAQGQQPDEPEEETFLSVTGCSSPQLGSCMVPRTGSHSQPVEAVKMDASQRREEPCSVPIALHCRKLITTLPSKIIPALACPTLTVHPSLNLPPPQPQPKIQPQPA
ncbi:hypothetical protein Q5P01_006703 [Channa striata]|uniref:Uncharacterized protein n=1 Tax=Channa striata TaxID=64152 RepID=A0AA88SX75_CHASR|nr:hypothetical protein Q5P01_006703 [Channa striata]